METTHVAAALQGYARVLRLVGLEHVDLVSMDDPGGKARLDEGRELVERGKRQAQVLAARRRVRDCVGVYP